MTTLTTLLIQFAVHILEAFLDRDNIDNGGISKKAHALKFWMWVGVYALFFIQTGSIMVLITGLLIRHVTMTYILNWIRGLDLLHLGDGWFDTYIAKVFAFIRNLVEGGIGESEIDVATKNLYKGGYEPTFTQVATHAFWRKLNKYRTIFVLFWFTFYWLNTEGPAFGDGMTLPSLFVIIVFLGYFFGEYMATKKMLMS